MKNFDKFHGNVFNDDISVFKVDSENEISGTLKLDGGNTVADLFSKKAIGLNTTEEGWFNLDLYKDHKTKGEDKILLHDALVMGGPRFLREVGLARTKVFPNMVIFDAQCLTEDFRLSKVSFSLEKLSYFFWFSEIEQHSFWGADNSVTMGIVDAARGTTKAYWDERDEGYGSREYDFNDPQDLYIVHRAPDELKFEVGNHNYHIWMGRYGSMPRGGIDSRAQPQLDIKFDKLISIDEAMQEVQSWHWFFNQVAFEKLDLMNLSATASENPEDGSADFYMPNYVTYKEKGRTCFHPSHAPFAAWRDREKLLAFLSAWLTHSTKRCNFRLMLNGTLEGRDSQDSTEQIGRLCAAIDSLREIESPDKIDKDIISEMSAAATTRASELGIEVPRGRTKGLLGSLNRPSLKYKISFIAQRAKIEVEPDKLALFIRKVIELRQVSAHGSNSTGNLLPIAYPISEALKAMCVLFDLSTSSEGIEDFEFKKTMAYERFGLCFANAISIINQSAAKQASG